MSKRGGAAAGGGALTGGAAAAGGGGGAVTGAGAVTGGAAVTGAGSGPLTGGGAGGTAMAAWAAGGAVTRGGAGGTAVAAGAAVLDVRDHPGMSGDDREERFERILLASEGRPIPAATVDRVIELAKRSGATVHVFSIARVHGVSFGLQTPGLLPTKHEWAEQRDIVSRAVRRLERKGIEADGHVLGTRKATKAICKEADTHGCDAIVMAADPDKNRFTGDFMWTQEPQRVRRKAKLPVFLVVEDE